MAAIPASTIRGATRLLAVAVSIACATACAAEQTGGATSSRSGSPSSSAPSTTATSPPTSQPVTSRSEVARWVPEIIDRIPHDPEAFTQGLVVDGDVLWESTGLYGESTLRRTDRSTGEVLETVALDPELFGEGLTLVGDRLIQLTWREEKALVWDAATLERVGELAYTGEGWGICRLDTDVVVTSDGSATLTRRDAETFDPLETVEVRLEGALADGLNELECVDGLVFANVWPTDDIVAVDATSGEVTAVIDASALDAELGAVQGRDVLNGIAYDPISGTYLLSGKLWPVTFEVRFVGT